MVVRGAVSASRSAVNAASRYSDLRVMTRRAGRRRPGRDGSPRERRVRRDPEGHERVAEARLRHLEGGAERLDEDELLGCQELGMASAKPGWIARHVADVGSIAMSGSAPLSSRARQPRRARRRCGSLDQRVLDETLRPAVLRAQPDVVASEANTLDDEHAAMGVQPDATAGHPAIARRITAGPQNDATELAIASENDGGAPCARARPGRAARPSSGRARLQELEGRAVSLRRRPSGTTSENRPTPSAPAVAC